MRPYPYPAILAFAALALTGQAFAQSAAQPQSGPAARPQPQRPAQPAQSGPTPIPRQAFLATMDAEFRRMDADKNNILTRTEIEQFQRAVAITTAQARNRALFARLDADRNGQLSPEEFARLTVQPPPANAAPLLAQVDGNKDGQVTLVEYRTGKLANFDRMDTDKDGIVSVAEMRAAGIVK